MGIKHLNSHITVRAKDTYMLELGASVVTCRRKRGTEVDALERAAYGDQIAASHAAAAYSAIKNDLLRCSDCVKDKYFEAFPVCRSYPWRHGGRGYYCLECVARRREETKRRAFIHVIIDPADEARLRAKPNNRRKGAKNLDIRAATA